LAVPASYSNPAKVVRVVVTPKLGPGVTSILFRVPLWVSTYTFPLRSSICVVIYG